MLIVLCESAFCQNLDGRDLRMIYLTKIPISLLLLNQIGWDFWQNTDNLLYFENTKAY